MLAQRGNYPVLIFDAMIFGINWISFDCRIIESPVKNMRALFLFSLMSRLRSNAHFFSSYYYNVH